MRASILQTGILLAFLYGAIATAGQGTATMTAAEKYIRESEEAWAQSNVTRDTTLLKQFIADDFIGISPSSGERYTKKELLEYAANATEHVSSHVDEMTVRFYGSTAVAQGSESFVLKDGRRGRYVWTDTWLRRRGKWQIVAAEDILVKEPGSEKAVISKSVAAHNLTTTSKYPAVAISEYTLLTDDLERQRSDAEAIMQAKIDWPRAMQTKDPADFEKVLGKNFIHHGSAGLMDRQAYLKDRLGNPSKVKTAVYDNLVLQIFPDHAILTYHNIVEEEPGGPTAWKEGMTWMDTFVKEDGRWKVAASRMIHLDVLNDPKAPRP
jgi:ketosteroid isomerase-like protein